MVSDVPKPKRFGISQVSEATITDERYNRRVEEEAISKLERLGYPRRLADDHDDPSSRSVITPQSVWRGP